MIGSYLDTSDAEIIAFTRLKRAELMQARSCDRGETLRFSRSTIMEQRLREAGYAYRKPLRPHERYISVETHDAILEAQEGRCYICGNPFTDEDWATQDHVIPESLGGVDILLAHALCNFIKDDRHPTREELAYLARIKQFLSREGEPR